MAAESDFNADFWLTVATAAPVLLVAFATTFVDLMTRNRETSEYRRRSDRLWATFWINAVPPLGALLTLGAVIALAVRADDALVRTIAILAFAALLFGVLSSGITIVSLQKRFPPRRKRLWVKESRGLGRIWWTNLKERNAPVPDQHS